MIKQKKNAPQKLLNYAGIHCPHHKRLKLSVSSVAWVVTIHRYGPLPSIYAHCSSLFWTKCSWPSTMTYSFQYFQNSMFNCDLVFGEKLIYIFSVRTECKKHDHRFSSDNFAVDLNCFAICSVGKEYWPIMH